MRFAASFAALLALAGSALAQTSDFIPVTKPLSNEKIPAGTTYQVEWTVPAKYSSGSITISLIGGKDQASLTAISTLATGVKISDAKYSWAVDSALGTAALYGLVVTLESDKTVFQFSNPFHITAAEGGSGNGTTTVTSTSASGTRTVTLSSASTTASAETETESSTTAAPTTTSASGPRTITSVVTAGAGGSPTTTSRPSTPNAGARATAGAVAGFAGLALAALAL